MEVYLPAMVFNTKVAKVHVVHVGHVDAVHQGLVLVVMDVDLVVCLHFQVIVDLSLQMDSMGIVVLVVVVLHLELVSMDQDIQGIHIQVVQVQVILVCQWVVQAHRDLLDLWGSSCPVPINRIRATEYPPQNLG